MKASDNDIIIRKHLLEDKTQIVLPVCFQIQEKYRIILRGFRSSYLNLATRIFSQGTDVH